MPNLFENVPLDVPDEVTTVLAESEYVRVERIVSTGQSSPKGFWYDQQQDEWVVVLKGAATLQFDDGEVAEMRPGDYVMIPAHRRHRVRWTSPNEPTVWLGVFFST